MSGDDRTASASERMRWLRAAVLERRELWGWGCDTGLLPWKDRRGRTMLAFWRSEARATEENAGQAEHGERAIRATVEELLERVPRWRKAGVRQFGLEPLGERILYSLGPAEFAEFLRSGRAQPRKLP